MEYGELRNTVFGEVLAGLMGSREIPATPATVRELAEPAGVDGDALVERMTDPDAEWPGYLEGVSAVLELTEPERSRLALAYTFERREPRRPAR